MAGGSTVADNPFDIAEEAVSASVAPNPFDVAEKIMPSISHGVNPNLVSGNFGGTNQKISPDTMLGEDFGHDLMAAVSRPAVALPKFTVNPDDSKAMAVAKSAANLGISLPEFAESPLGIATMGAGTVIPKTVAALFLADTAKSTGEQATQMGSQWDTMKPAEKAAALTDITGTTLLATTMGHHAAGGLADVIDTRVNPAGMLARELNRTPLQEQKINPRAVSPIISGALPSEQAGTTIEPLEPIKPDFNVAKGRPVAPPKVTIPEVSPEEAAERNLIKQIRESGATTVPEIQKMFDDEGITREEARRLRNLSYPNEDELGFTAWLKSKSGQGAYSRALELQSKPKEADSAAGGEPINTPLVGERTPPAPPAKISAEDLQAAMRGNQLKPSETKPAEPATVEHSQPEAATSPAAPVASDFARYQQLTQQASEGVKRGEFPPPEVQREIEAIKNRNGGMAPRELSQPEVEAAKNAPAESNQVLPEQSGEPTSIKNAVVDEERAKRGLPPVVEPARRSFGTVWDDATKTIEKDPNAQTQLIDELRQNPRAVTDKEDAMLLQRQITLQNEHAKTLKDLNEAADKGDTAAVQEHRISESNLSDQLLDLYNINKRVGTETGRGLNARRMMANEDYTLAAMETRLRAAKDGKQLTPEEKSIVAETADKVQKTLKAIEDYLAQASKKPIRSQTTTASSGNAGAVRTFISEQAAEARKRIAAKSGRLSAGIDPTLLVDHAIVGAEYLAKGVTKIG